MFAMIVLLALCFRAATIAVSMAIDRPETIDAASACGPKRSGGCQAGDFLASRGMAAQPPGEESRTTALRLVDRGVAGLRPDQAINETEWCALPGTEKSMENPAIIIGPTADPAARKSFALLEPLAPGSRNSTPVYPDRRFCRASIGTPAPNRTTSRLIRQVPMRTERGFCSDQTGSGHIRLIGSRQQFTTAPVFGAPPKQRSGMPQAVSTP